MHIAVDIDGILTLETQGFSEEIYMARTPNEGNILRTNLLYSEGHIVTLFTARFEQDREITERWLEQHNVSYDTLIMGKLHYDILIDDKAQPEFENPINLMEIDPNDRPIPR